MGKFFVCVTGLCLAVSIVLAADEQALLGIYAETAQFRVAGAKADAGAAQRHLTVRLWSPGIAAEDAVAELALPERLKLGRKIAMQIFRAQAGDPVAANGFNPDEVKDFTLKWVFGSADTVKDGQAEEIRWDAMTDDQKTVLRRMANEMARRNAYYYKPNWTTAYWPDAKRATKISDDATLAGTYSLTTNYSGNVEINVPETVTFLPAIEVTAPDLKAPIALDAAMRFTWKAMPGMLGYHIMVFGRQGNNRLIIWDSSEKKTAKNIDWSYLDARQIKDQLARQAVLPADKAEVTIPAGIFKDCDVVYLSMIGYGQGTEHSEGKPATCIQTKTVLGVVLGLKEIPNDAAIPAGDEKAAK